MQQCDYMCSDDEDYGLEDLDYSEGSSSELDVNLENQYYNGKALKAEHPRDALTTFQNVVDLEDGNLGDWGFKALKQMVKINFQIGEYENAIKNYKKLLCYIKNAVTRNKGEKSINSLLDCISNSKDVSLLQDFYKTTLAALKDTKNPRLWFKCNIKLGKIYLERKERGKFVKLINELHEFCKCNQDEDECCKGTQLLEIYALEIQFYTQQKNTKALKTLYKDALKIKSAIPHPLIMSIIRECGGKMHLKAGDYEEARTDFFEAFKNYDEAGNARRTDCLKYFILASMLLKTNINPLDSQEAKAYKNDPDIMLMTDLVTAYQNGDMETFQSILRENKNIMEHAILDDYFEELLRNMRVRYLIQTIQPYSRIRISYICDRLKIEECEAESLLISCILDGSIKGRIDQINQILVLRPTETNSKYEAIDKWTESLEKICVNFHSFHLQ